jgi:hypothetical protein
VLQRQPQEIVFTIPIFEPLPSQYYIRAISDRWIGSETYCAISFQVPTSWRLYDSPPDPGRFVPRRR